MEKIRDLSGHSGCLVSLYRNEKKYFIRKKSGGIGYNDRLRQQCSKQRAFVAMADEINLRSPNETRIFSPQIYKEGEESGLYYFDMEYVKGWTLTEYTNIAKIGSVVAIAERLNDLFSLMKANASYSSESQFVFRKKIQSLLPSVLNDAEFVSPVLDQLLKSDFSTVPTSFCFGDLSLENILITESGDICFIDLLDSFYDSYLLDVSKLLMDIECGWSNRAKVLNVNSEVRLLILKKVIQERFERDQTESCLKILNDLKILHALRILPYTKDTYSRLVLIKYLVKVSGLKCEL